MKKARFTISKNKVIEQYDKLKPLADIISYSSKTNPIITKILEKETDCLFSIHLENELKNIKDNSRILFLAQAWDKRQIKELLDKGIRRFVIDNIPDLDILLETIKETKKKIDLMLRTKLKEFSIRTERYFVFGIDSEKVNKKIKELHKNKNISSLGIHFHRKTQNMAEWSILKEIDNMFDDETLKIINCINIGGGLPSEYANTNTKVIGSILEKIKELKEFLNKQDIKLMLEPGRFIAAPAGKLITKIRNIYNKNIVVNASVYNSDMDAIIVPVKLLVKGELEKGKGQPYVIKGITPCSLDLFRYRVYLDDPKIGDEIIFINAGAYNFTSDFCDLERLETEIVE